MFYSKSQNAFYNQEINGDSMPDDVIEISDEKYYALLNAQSNGKTIKPDANGNPIATDSTDVPTDDQIATMRELAYRAEADPLFFKWQRAEASREEWLAKIAEIRQRFPKSGDIQ